MRREMDTPLAQDFRPGGQAARSVQRYERLGSQTNTPRSLDVKLHSADKAALRRARARCSRIFTFSSVASTGRCNSGGEDSRRCFPAQCLSWPGVEP